MKYFILFFFQILSIIYLVNNIYNTNGNEIFRNKYLIILSYFIILIGLFLTLYFLKIEKKK